MIMEEKERLIAHLKSQLEILQQNEKDYQDLNFLLTNLEHRYNLLNEEKQRMENDFARRNEFNMQTIAMHRADIDQLREDLQSEQNNDVKNRDVLDEKTYENNQLFEELVQVRQAYNNLLQEHQEAGQTIMSYEQEMEHLNQQLEQLSNLQQNEMKGNKQDQLKVELREMREECDKLQAEKKSISRQLERNETKLQNYENQLRSTSEELGKLQHQNQQLSKDFKDLQIQKVQFSLNLKLQQGNNQQQVSLIETELKNQKAINQQLITNNDHFQNKMETLIKNNQQLIIDNDMLNQQMERIRLLEKEKSQQLDISNLSIKEDQGLKRKVQQLQLRIDDLESERKQLVKNNSVLEEMITQLQSQNQIIRHSVHQQSTHDLEQFIHELEHENKLLKMELKERSMEQSKSQQLITEKMRNQIALNQEYQNLQLDFDNLQKEYNLVMRVNQNEISKTNQLKKSYEFKEIELNKIIRTIEQLEKENFTKEEELRNALKENEKLRQEKEAQAKNLNKMYEESKIIKDYLRIQYFYQIL